MQTLIIEVSGGVVQEVYTDARKLRVIKVDWDVGESPGDEHWTVEYTTARSPPCPPKPEKHSPRWNK